MVSEVRKEKSQHKGIDKHNQQGASGAKTRKSQAYAENDETERRVPSGKKAPWNLRMGEGE